MAASPEPRFAKWPQACGPEPTPKSCPLNWSGTDPAALASEACKGLQTPGSCDALSAEAVGFASMAKGAYSVLVGMSKQSVCDSQDAKKTLQGLNDWLRPQVGSLSPSSQHFWEDAWFWFALFLAVLSAFLGAGWAKGHSHILKLEAQLKKSS